MARQREREGISGQYGYVRGCGASTALHGDSAARGGCPDDDDGQSQIRAAHRPHRGGPGVQPGSGQHCPAFGKYKEGSGYWDWGILTIVAVGALLPVWEGGAPHHIK